MFPLWFPFFVSFFFPGHCFAPIHLSRKTHLISSTSYNYASEHRRSANVYFTGSQSIFTFTTIKCYFFKSITLIKETCYEIRIRTSKKCSKNVQIVQKKSPIFETSVINFTRLKYLTKTIFHPPCARLRCTF